MTEEKKSENLEEFERRVIDSKTGRFKQSILDKYDVMKVDLKVLEKDCDVIKDDIKEAIDLGFLVDSYYLGTGKSVAWKKVAELLQDYFKIPNDKFKYCVEKFTKPNSPLKREKGF